MKGSGLMTKYTEEDSFKERMETLLKGIGKMKSFLDWANR